MSYNKKWKNFLSESKLRVFDFDDTLVKTDATVKLTRPDGTKEELTPGEFSHKENPLKVVDKNGQDTGMELTGGEGVFDQKAMTMLDRYKNNNDYNKAGKLVFKEMDSWVGAGTAKYGTRIKEY